MSFLSTVGHDPEEGGNLLWDGGAEATGRLFMPHVTFWRQAEQIITAGDR